MKLEADLTKAVKRYFKKIEFYNVKYHGGYGGVSGVPDFLGCYRGKFVGLELKADGKKATALQLENINQIRNNGGFADVFWSVEEIKEFIKFIDKEIANEQKRKS